MKLAFDNTTKFSLKVFTYKILKHSRFYETYKIHILCKAISIKAQNSFWFFFMIKIFQLKVDFRYMDKTSTLMTACVRLTYRVFIQKFYFE